MPASGFRSQIALRNDTAARLFQSLRQLFQQKLAFDFAVARRSPVHRHKIKMLNAIGFAVEIFAQRETRRFKFVGHFHRATVAMDAKDWICCQDSNRFDFCVSHGDGSFDPGVGEETVIAGDP